MTVITLTIFIAYAGLMVLSLILDPKRKKIRSRVKGSILYMLLFSTFKMLFAIAIVIAVILASRTNLSRAVGFSGFSFSPQSIGYGVIAAIGFVVIYVLWQAFISRFSKGTQSEESASGIIDMLPRRWLPLIIVFVAISLEAGLLEEIFFRGIMQSHAADLLMASWAAVASGILFGFAHFYQGVSGIVGTSILGVWLGVAFAVTGNILVPILGHFLGDFTCMMLGAKTIMLQKNDTIHS